MSEHISRDELERRIAARLAKLDRDSLLRLDAISAYAEARARTMPLPISGGTAESYVESSEGSISRRKFLIGVGAGGAVLAGTAIGGALIGSALNDPDLLKMRALLALYEQLEQVGLDAIVSGSLKVLSGILNGLKTIAGAVNAGVKFVDGALAGFEKLFPTVRQGIAVVEGLVSGLAKVVRDIQQLVTDVTGSVRPLTDGIGKFFSDLLDKIPFGVGTNVKNLVNAIIELIGSVPKLIESLNTQLITPLKTDWFTDDERKGLKGNLIEPTRKNLLQPTSKLLQEIENFSGEWDANIAPINKAIAQRAEIRNQIADVQAGKTTRATAAP